MPPRASRAGYEVSPDRPALMLFHVVGKAIGDIPLVPSRDLIYKLTDNSDLLMRELKPIPKWRLGLLLFGVATSVGLIFSTVSYVVMARVAFGRGRIGRNRRRRIPRLSLPLF